MKKMIIILSFISVFFSQCFSPNIPLSKKEKGYLNYLKRKYKCDVSFFHDFEAVNDSKKIPVFHIVLSDSQMRLCFSDTLKLKKIALDIESKLNDVIDTKIDYHFVEIEFSESIYPDERSQDVICSKRFSMALENTTIDNIEIKGYYSR